MIKPGRKKHRERGFNLEEILLSIKNLRKSYGSKAVLNGVSFQVKRGEIIGYIGPNGAGKSTTIKIMLGIENEYMGEVEIFGQDIAAESIEY